MCFFSIFQWDISPFWKKEQYALPFRLTFQKIERLLQKITQCASAQFATRCRQSFLLHACSIFFFSLDALYYFVFFFFFHQSTVHIQQKRKWGKKGPEKARKIHPCNNHAYLPMHSLKIVIQQKRF